MSDFESNSLTLTVAMVLITGIALIVQGRSLFKMSKSIDELREQNRIQTEILRQQALSYRVNILLYELSLIDKFAGRDAQLRHEKLMREIDAAKSTFNPDDMGEVKS